MPSQSQKSCDNELYTTTCSCRNEAGAEGAVRCLRHARPHYALSEQHNARIVAHESDRDLKVRFGFSAGGLLFPFYIGVCRGLEASGYMSERTKLAGASAGSLIAACVNSGLSMDTVSDLCRDLMEGL
eukprot:jgi/Picre1/28187/NNA_003593.t1